MRTGGTKALLTVEVVVGAAIWLITARRLVLEAPRMALLDVFGAVMILVIGPALLWQAACKWPSHDAP